MILTSLLWLTLAQAQSLTCTLTARPVGAVLAEASKQLNVQLTANDEANREIVLVSVDHMPLKSFMDRIAGVFHGSTAYVSDGYGAYHSRSVVMGGSALLDAVKNRAAKASAAK